VVDKVVLSTPCHGQQSTS